MQSNLAGLTSKLKVTMAPLRLRTNAPSLLYAECGRFLPSSGFTSGWMNGGCIPSVLKRRRNQSDVAGAAAFFERTKKSSRNSRNYTLLVVPVLTFGLGTWQLYRLKWKLGLIDERTTRLRAPALTMDDLPDDTTVLVDRGWVHKSLLNPDTRQKGQILGQVEIYGALRNAEVRNKFTPIEKLGSSNFHVRDIDAMAKALGTVPVFLEALKESNIPGGPVGGQTIVQMRNEHLNYAITWYSLSAITALLWYYRYVKRRSFR